MKKLVYLLLIVVLFIVGCSSSGITGETKYFPNEKAYELHKTREALKNEY